jgi:hypothetical protein
MMLFGSLALLVVLLLTLESDVYWAMSIPTVMGIVLSIVWLKINALSSRHAQRLQEEMKATIEEDKTLQEWLKGRALSQTSRSFADKGNLFYFNLVPYAFLSLWFFVFLSFVSSVGSRGPSESVRLAISTETQSHTEDKSPAVANQGANQDEGPGAGVDVEMASEPVGTKGRAGGGRQVYVDSRMLAKQRKVQEARQGAGQDEDPGTGAEEEMTSESVEIKGRSGGGGQVYVDGRMLAKQREEQKTRQGAGK